MSDPRTTLIHHSYAAPAGFDAPQPGVHKASTVFFPDVAAMRSREWKDKTAYTYGLHGTPTSYLLEERIATLEGALQCLLVPSGLAAIATVALSLLRSGDEVLIPDNAYGPNKSLAAGELKAFGITHQYYDPMDLADLERRISPRTRLVWLEAAGSVTLEFPDLVGQVRACRAAGVLCALDNTWGAGLAFHAYDLLRQSRSMPATAGATQAQEDPAARLGVDLTIHALTKYPSGGGDVLMGAITTRDADLHLRLKLTHMRLGLGVGMNDVEAILRALPSLALRYDAHDRCARDLASWCLGRPEFAQVLHPALPDSAGHDNWRMICGAGDGRAAGLFSVVVDARHAQEQVDAFCNRLRLFRLGYSWGGPISLVVPYELQSMRVSWPTHLRRGTVVRFSVGLEAFADLRDDLAQALDALR